MDAHHQVLTAVTDALGREPGPRPLSVAFSAGMDSTVLLEAVRRVALDRGLAPPRALHVDHGLEPEAVAWRDHAAHWCAARDIAFHPLPVTVLRGRGDSPEEAAREARYAAFAGVLEPGELLCVAHHAHDQAETVLLHLLRGSGALGAGAMRPRRALGSGVLVRPLLGLERQVLADCARRWELTWVSDPGNRRLHHPRNRLRHQVIPLLQAINPSAVAAMCRSATLNQESAELARILTARDLEACGNGPALALRRGALTALPSSRTRAVLRLWLRRAGAPVPGHAFLGEVERQIRQAARDRNPAFALGSLRLTVHGDQVRLIPAATVPALHSPCALESWSPGAAVDLPGGRLWAEPGAGRGLRPGAPLKIRFRAGGERCRPVGRRHSQTLKRLFQEYRVPAWLRPELPLLYREGDLVGVAGLFVCHGHEAAPGENGWLIRWQARSVSMGGGAGSLGEPGQGEFPGSPIGLTE